MGESAEVPPRFVADATYDAAVAYRDQPRWYRWDRFPIVPVWSYRPAKDWSESNWHFNWLGLRVWTMMCPHLGASIELDDQGIEARLYVPYLIIAFRIPLFPWRWHQKLWRKGPRQ